MQSDSTQALPTVSFARNTQQGGRRRPWSDQGRSKMCSRFSPFKQRQYFIHTHPRSIHNKGTFISSVTRGQTTNHYHPLFNKVFISITRWNKTYYRKSTGIHSSSVYCSFGDIVTCTYWRILWMRSSSTSIVPCRRLTVANVCHITRVAVHIVGDCLKATVGQEDRVGAPGLPVLPRLLVAEVAPSVAVLHRPPEVVPGLILWVFLGVNWLWEKKNCGI